MKIVIIIVFIFIIIISIIMMNIVEVDCISRAYLFAAKKKSIRPSISVLNG